MPVIREPKPTKKTVACLQKNLIAANKEIGLRGQRIDALVSEYNKAEARLVRVNQLIADFDRRAQMTNELRKVARPDSHDEMEAGSSALTWQRAANLLRKAYG